jgi:glutamate-ammonia-ligase adenylyltransferase
MQSGNTHPSALERDALYQEVVHRCPTVAPQVIATLFEQLDAEYFTLFTPPQIAAHVQLLSQVSAQRPVTMRVAPRNPKTAEVLIVGYDFFGEFSLMTGLMASFGLNILEGQVFSYQSGPGRTTPWGHIQGGMIIDTFVVEFAPERPFDAAAQAHFATRLTELLRLLEQGKLQEARDRLNYQLIDAIRASHRTFSARLYPVHVAIDNASSPDWTIVRIVADDTPGFLYSLSNALAMRNVNIHRLSIRSAAGEVRDTLSVSRHRGGKITSEAGQRELRLIVVLIKQFTHFLTIAPDPVKALRHFDQLLDRLAPAASSSDDFRWLWEEKPLKALATVLGSSDFLWEDFLRMQHTTLLPILQDMGEMEQPVEGAELASRLARELAAAGTESDRKAALNTFKDREMFRIDMRHLLHPELPFGSFSEELTTLAEVVLSAALEVAARRLQSRYGAPLLADGQRCAFALFGLGKFGGRELGYASDIELLCVYEGPGTTAGPECLTVGEYAEMLVQQLRDLLVVRRAGIFELDLRLRPFGSHGPLATSLASFRTYYHPTGQAADFERQALIKLRWTAGDRELGALVEAERDAFVYSPQPFDLTAAMALRQRQIDELVTPGTVDTKYSPGGLIDIEYTVQYLQLMHGATTPAVRTPNTLTALEALHDTGRLTADEYQQLRQAYVFLRHLIDALRIVRGHARDLVLPSSDSEEFVFLARRMGYWDAHGTTARLARDIRHHMQRAAHIYRQRFVPQGRDDASSLP